MSVNERRNLQIPLYIDTFFDNGNEIWFINYNALCSLNKRTGEISVEMFLQEDIQKRNLYRYSVLCEDKLVFIPTAAEKILIFDLGLRTSLEIDIKVPIHDAYNLYSEDNKFMTAAVWKNYVFLIGGTYSAIIRLDIVTNELIYIYDIHKELTRLVKNQTLFFAGQCLVEKNMLYIPTASSSLLLILNMETLEFELTAVGENGGNFVGICKSDNDIWLTGTDRRLARYNLSTKRCEVFQIPVDYTGIGSPYVKIACDQGKVYLYGYNVYKHFIYDIESKQFTEMKLQMGADLDIERVSFYFLYGKDSWFEGYCREQRCFIQIDNWNRINNIYYLENTKEVLDRWEMDRLKKKYAGIFQEKGSPLGENQEYNLKGYIEYIKGEPMDGEK